MVIDLKHWPQDFPPNGQGDDSSGANGPNVGGIL